MKASEERYHAREADRKGSRQAERIVISRKTLLLTESSVTLVQATFFMFRVFPPPAPGADIFSGFYSSCAGGTANAGIILFMQGVDGYVVLLNIGCDLFLGPFRERIDFYKWRMIRIFHDFRNICPCDPLLPP